MSLLCVRVSPWVRILSLIALGASGSQAADISTAGPPKTGLKGPDRIAEPAPHPASIEPGRTMKKFRLLPGFQTDLWAAEPMLGNPVAFCLDDQGRVFVAETWRYRTSTLDIRHYMFMLEDDLASRSTEDRVAFTKKNFPNEWQTLEIETEVVRFLEDRDGDGIADFTSPYAAGMNTIMDGINSGVLAHDGKLWCTNMPNLWLFSGLTKDGQAEKREVLSTGYGVRFSFTGHDMHGLIIGPDGRLYFSFGDRGATVKTKEGKTIALPDEGAVFRCELDGSHLELVHRGLRNPQELAFDNHGNLFTGDNDSDQGDRERWVYIVEGGDSGWRVGWQHNPQGKEHNPWLSEAMWEPRSPGKEQPAYILSPILNIPDGPSGIVHYPGTGLPVEFADSFLICGFKGSSARSSITSLRVKESGAGFEVAQQPENFIGDVQATDVDFAPDSKIYFSEWGEGWEGTGRGRIFRAWQTEAQHAQAAQIAEVKKLLGEGFKQRPSEELAKLLAHKDQRVRLRAQWALAVRALAKKRTPEAEQLGRRLLEVAANGIDGPERHLSQLHAVWCVGQIARQLTRAAHPNGDAEIPAPKPGNPILCEHPDAEVRAQALNVVAQIPGRLSPELAKVVAAKLADPVPRVRYFAAMALANHHDATAVPALIRMIRENDDKDQYLRHAGVRALAAAGDAAVAAATSDAAASVRLAALLAMRQAGKPEIAHFFGDPNPQLVKEAARAINDTPIDGAFGALATLIESPSKDMQLMLRVINANFRAGTDATAQALARFSSDEAASEPLRLEALRALATWPKPFPRDRVTGVYRPLPSRDAQPAVAALREAQPKLLAAKPANVVGASIDAVAALQMKDQAPALFALMAQPQLSATVRGKVLETLAAFDDPKLSEAIKLALTDKNPGLRVTASTILGKLDPDEAARQLRAAFADAQISEKKSIITALGSLKSGGADKALSAWLEELRAGKLLPEIQLELLEAAAKRAGAEVKQKLAAYENSLPATDALAKFTPALAGGVKEDGETIFKENAVAQCFRCHKVAGSGGDAGPDLTEIGAKKERRYLLESIVLPNLHIAEGFQSILVTLKNGDIQVGIVKEENDKEVTLQLPAPGVPPVIVKTADIQTREHAPSGMPPGMGEMLTKRQLRDLVEYLASLK